MLITKLGKMAIEKEQFTIDWKEVRNKVDMDIEELKGSLDSLKKNGVIDLDTGLNGEIRNIKLTRKGFKRYLRKHYEGKNYTELLKHIAKEVDEVERGNSEKIADNLDIPILIVNFILEHFEINSYINLSNSLEKNISFFVVSEGFSENYN